MRIPKTVLAVLFAGALAPSVPAAARTLPADEPQAQQKQTLDQVKKDTPQDAVVGFLGVNYGGGLYGGGIVPSVDLFGNPKVYGVSLLYKGDGLFASEIDLGYNPGFYDGLPVVSPDGKSTMYTLTLNMVIGPTFYIGQGGRIRPYGLFGGGLMRSSISEFKNFLSLVDTKNLFTWDWGVGIYVYPVRQIGFRGEFRRFQAVGTNNLGLGWGEIKDWNYYRLTIGLALAF
jgi:opacity protein-like surface antigen